MIKHMAECPNEKKQYDSINKNIFNDPDNYFSLYFGGHQVILGKKPTAKIEEIVKLKSNIYKKRKKIFSETPSTIKKKLTEKKTTNKAKTIETDESNENTIGPIGPIVSQKIGRDDVEKKFDYFEQIERKNIKSNNLDSEKNILKYDSPDLKRKLKGLLNKQENAIKLFKKQQSENKRILNKISSKIKRESDSLLMTKTRNFRMSKEAKTDLELKNKDIFDNRPKPWKWITSLRRDKGKKNVYYINSGNIYNPKWHMKILSPTNEKEHIRLGTNYEEENNYYLKTYTNFERLLKTDIHKNTKRMIKEYSNKPIKLSRNTNRNIFPSLSVDLENKEKERIKNETNYFSVSGQKLLTVERKIFLNSKQDQYNEMLFNKLTEDDLKDINFK